MRVFEELKRRNVIRVGIAYVVIAWLIAQVGELALDTFNAPEWVMKTILVVLALGLPLALFFAWVFELTPEGIKKEKDVDHSQSIAPKTGRKLDDDLFFTDGIHDDLLTQLAKIKGLKVISRTTMMQYRDTTKTIPEIAKELDVAKILEGGVQRAGQRIRVNAQLIDVAGDEHLWAETFDREMMVDNLFDIQSEITRQIVTAIKGQLTPEEQQILEDKPTNSLAARGHYLYPRWDFFRDDERFNELIRPANLDETKPIRTPVGQ